MDIRAILNAAATAVLLAGCASARYQPLYLDGTVAAKSGTVLPAADTTLKVRLLDISREGAPAVVLAEQYQDRPKSPASFSLCYDARALKPGHVYTVEASVYVNGELKLVSRQQPRVLASDSPVRPQVTVEPVEQ